jgi:poly-gamma-glutamate synthesis protein (capsule biosynthesis protein)
MIWLAPYLPEKLVESITLPEGYSLASSQEGADVILTVDTQAQSPSSQWVYALVAPFPTVMDGVSFEQLQSAWNGNPPEPFASSPLLMDETTKDVLEAYWGKPAENAVSVLSAGELLEHAWSNQPAWAIIPFEELEPRWKVLAVDGKSPLWKAFDLSGYPLTIPFVLQGKQSLDTDLINLPQTNRDPSRLTTVAMTGVTAMVRATAFSMEHKGITYPAEYISPLLTEADITHISNEIPFSPDCPYPTITQENLVFCSNPSYIDLLKAVGTDIIELTGDHFMDYGAEATLYTLQMYKDLGWPYYGGGADAEEARQPIRFRNNGNKIAFMGCNVGCTVKNEIPCDAIATETHPGAAQCDFNYISSEISALRDEDYQVIFTFQHREYYTYTAMPSLVNDFGLVASAGAAIVSGSQAHQPHGFSFENDAFIHYGLGNLFFDQFGYCVDRACDDAFIDRHVFYDGRYISTELITLRFVDFAQPRFMTQEERAKFLETIFNASGW